MRVCADENVAPVLSELIREQLLSRSFSLETVHDHQASGVDDQIWVRKFAEAGGDAIVGADMAMTKRPHEIAANNETGLRIIILDERWPRQKKNVQISFLFYWWPAIENILSTAGAGKCFKVPWGWPADTDGQIKPIAVDLQKAYKQIKKQK